MTETAYDRAREFSPELEEDHQPPVKVLGRKVLRPRQQIEETLRNAILTGRLRYNERFPPEAELARQFGVSRTTVREALRSLATDHLIEKVPGKHGGSFVRCVDHRALGQQVQDTLNSLLQLKSLETLEVARVLEMLEIPAARLAAVNRTSAELERLSAIVQRQREISGGSAELAELGAEFHRVVAEASRNRVLASFVGALYSVSHPVQYVDLSAEVSRETANHHAKLVRAFERQDPDAAEKATVDHEAYLQQHLLDKPRSREVGADFD